MATLELPIAGERYRHWKGSVYLVQSCATDEATGERVVIYRRWGDDEGPPELFARSLTSWHKPTTVGTSRFQHLTGDSCCFHCHGRVRFSDLVADTAPLTIHQRCWATYLSGEFASNGDTRCAMCGRTMCDLPLEQKWHAGGMAYHQGCYDQLAAIMRPDEPWPATPDELTNRLKEHRTMGLHDHHSAGAGAAIGPGPNIGTGRHIGLGDPVDLTRAQADRIEATRYAQQQVERGNACAPTGQPMPQLQLVIERLRSASYSMADHLRRLSDFNERWEKGSSPVANGRSSGEVVPHPDGHSIVGQIGNALTEIAALERAIADEITAIERIG